MDVKTFREHQNDVYRKQLLYTLSSALQTIFESIHNSVYTQLVTKKSVIKLMHFHQSKRKVSYIRVLNKITNAHSHELNWNFQGLY